MENLVGFQANQSKINHTYTEILIRMERAQPATEKAEHHNPRAWECLFPNLSAQIEWKLGELMKLERFFDFDTRFHLSIEWTDGSSIH